MGVLQRFERRLEGLVEGAFARTFGGVVQPVEIAARLQISELTVKSHVGRVFTKLGLRDRAAAVVWAFDHGVVVPR